MKRTVLLVILDGWGIGAKDHSNPIFIQNPKNINYIKSHYPSGALQASGIAVGLPWGEEGNSEIGHLTLGAGKVIYQHYPRITLAIRNGEFFKNEALADAFKHALKNNSAVNLVGLLSDGVVHSSFDHLAALIEFGKKSGIKRLNLHLFTDGRDSPPQSLPSLLEKLQKVINQHQLGKIASLSGRYYAMNREQYWDRTRLAYDVLTGNGTIADIKEKIEKNHQKGLSDEFLEPFIAGPENNAIGSDDAIIFFNFREDSMRQIAGSFILPDFDQFPARPLTNLYIATMTKYSDKFDAPVAYSPETIKNPLGKILAENNKIQVRIAESQKYAHITYFFNGFQDASYKNEYRILIPSRNIPHHDQYPEMMAGEITSRAILTIEEGGADFILINYANPDVIAHSGNFEAALKAVSAVDDEIGKLTNAVLTHNAVMIITSDHGNIEKVRDPLTGIPETKHDISSVPIYLVAKKYEKIKNEALAEKSEKMIIGIISDVAPTILELLNIPQPKEMTGQSLIKKLI